MPRDPRRASASGGKAPENGARPRPGAPEDTAPRVFDAAVAYVPRILLEMLTADPARATPWCEWVDGTLVMADVSGFTAMSERLAKAGKEGAEWLTDIINWYFGRMLDIARGCGGSTLTFGGDAILLLFHGEDHERRAIAASLRMLHATQELPAYKVGNHKVKLSMSMGAHSGRFLAASVGSAARAQYLILGPETVRTAQAEAQASSGELAITAEMAQRVAGSTVLEPVGDFHRVANLVNTPRYGPLKEKDPGAVPSDVLAAYLPPFVSEVLLRDPSEPAPAVDHEHRNVTIAFVNVLGVDDILDADGAEGLLDELQRYVEPVLRLTDEHQGYLVSNDIYTNGFKLIVSFGAPAAHEHDAANALRFANAVRERIAEEDLRLSHRIGVNGGFVYAGDVGPAYRRQYTVMGDAVNLSARLMSAAEAGQVLVSAHTAEAAGEGFLMRELAPIRVKGKEHPIPICLVDGLCAATAAMPAGAGAVHGREAELAELDQARADVEDGSVRVALIRGEAGMGKSVLAAEFSARLAEAGWATHIGHSYEHWTAQPFVPWVPILGSVMGFGTDDDEATRTAKVLAAAGELGPVLAEWASLLGPLLGLSIPQTDLVRSSDAGSRRERMFDLVAALLGRAAERRPLLVHIEDAHWADRSSLELLEHVAGSVCSHRVLLLVTERLEGAPDLDLPALATVTVDLTELPRGAALDLMRETLGLELPEAAVAVLLEKTRGNPMYLQELARSIARSGVVASAADERELTRRLSELEVPDRIQGLLMSSIDSLPAQTKEVLRMASVVGTTFKRQTLHGAFGDVIGRADLDDCLTDLVCQSLLVETRTGRDRRYRFRHALIQDVAYDSLAFAKRRRMHHRVAEHLEDIHSERLEGAYEALVHHYQMSRDLPKTRVYAVKAGEKARGLLAHDEAIDYYRIGVQSLGARSAEAAWVRSYLLEQIGDCYHLTGRHRQAADAYKDALGRCHRAAGDVDVSAAGELLAMTDVPSPRTCEARLCHKIAAAYSRTHRDYDRSLRWLDRATEVLPPREPVLTSQIDATRSAIFVWTGHYEDAIRAARRSSAIARRLGDRALSARAAAMIAPALEELGEIPKSGRYRRRALELYEEVGDLPGQADAHSNLSVFYMLVGRLDMALHHALEALKIDERTGDLTGTAMTHTNVAEILIMQGRYDEAVEHLQTALERCERTGSGATTVVGSALLLLSRAYAALGRRTEAEERLQESVELLKHTGAIAVLAEARLEQAESLLSSGHVWDALTECQRGLSEARELGMVIVEMRGLRLRGRIAAARGDIDGAEHDLRESADLAGHASAAYDRGVALLDLAEVRAAAGRPYKRLLATAVALLEPTGATPDIERAEALRLAEEPAAASA